MRTVSRFHSLVIPRLEPIKAADAMTAVSQNWELLQLVQEQTPEVCMAAVSQNGWALKYVNLRACAEVNLTSSYASGVVKTQTPELSPHITYADICMTAVKEYWKALQFVSPEMQTPELCMAAVTQAGRALKLVHRQTPAICMAAVQQDGMALAHVKEQTPAICLAAIQQNRTSIWYVKKGVLSVMIDREDPPLNVGGPVLMQ